MRHAGSSGFECTLGTLQSNPASSCGRVVNSRSGIYIYIYNVYIDIYTYRSLDNICRYYDNNNTFSAALIYKYICVYINR